MPPRPLEPSSEEMRAMLAAAGEYLERFVRELPDAPASDLAGAAEMARDLTEPIPEEGRPFEEVLAVVERSAEKGFNTAGPGYLAYIPGGGLFAAALSELVAGTINRFVNLWSPAPALAQMEWQAVRWLCDLFDYPPEARGILTSGGSLSEFSAIVTARKALLPRDFLGGTLYVTDQTHASVAKSAYLAGFPPESVRIVPRTPELRMDPDTLADAVKRDRDDGRLPFCVVASAGTTNTGAIDPLDDIASLAADQGLWVHADAAYGGPFQITERGRRRFRGIERSDSITLDPHKAMFLPYGTGALLVRDGMKLRDAHHVGADYLQDLAAEEEIPNFTEYSPELSRNFRGLSVWLPLKLYGLRAWRDALDEKLDLTRHLYEELRATPGFEVPWEPEVTVVAFRYVGTRGGDVDDLNVRLLDRINASKRVFLSSTRIDGAFWIRACIVSHRTHRDRIEEAVEIIRSAAREIGA
ncbi:MAG TPA: pyridoxal-dependent decarboxylase [Actinomycetota bacterium]|nr:pyridoxal-dependent decarboxylase [Actinomycetota bacterium]